MKGINEEGYLIIEDRIYTIRGMQTMTPYGERFRTLLEELIPEIPASANVTPPFWCDHGNGIRLGEGSFLNFGCTILDGTYVTIGRHTLLCPNCQLYIPSILKTICCVILLRRRYDYWLGVNLTLYPGVIIDDRVIVVAGSVVVHDVPSDVMVTGNPVVVKRHLK